MTGQQQNNEISRQTHFPGEIAPFVGMMSESLAMIVWRSRWIVLATTLTALAAAMIYVTKATLIFTSTSRIYVEQSGPKIFTETEEGVMTQSKNYLYTQAELLASTPILTAAIEVPGTEKMQTFSGIDNPVSYMKKTLRVMVGKRDDILSVSFDSPYPAEAAQVVNVVVDAYITFHATHKKSTSVEVRKILDAEKDKRGAELTMKLKALADFKNENPALALESRQGNIIIDELERWSAALNEAQKNTIHTQSVYESTREMVGDPVKLKQFVDAQRAKGAYIARDSEGADLKSKLAKLQDHRADRLRQVTPDHPAVKALDTEIANIKTQIADLDQEFAQAQIAVTEQEYLAAKEREGQFGKYYKEQLQQTVELDQKITRYTLLQSDYERTQKDYDIVVERIKEHSATEDVGALNITILEYARPADKPSEPRKSRYMAMALVMGLVLGSGLGVLRTLMDQRLHSAEEISAVLEMPVLGVVPTMPRKESIVTRGKKTHLESKSHWAEAYRTIRTAVFFSAPKGEAKTILITSPTPADGKTTLASNLGIAMAQAGQRVVILDADFRKPTQRRIFGINHENHGLGGVLVGTVKLEEAINRTEIQGLDLLACGPDVSNPAEILNSEAFAKLLEHLSNKYDRVVIDSPPVILVTDALILGALCDVTVLVLRAEKSTKKTSQQARHGLLSVGANVLGAVVNDVPKKSHYGYYGYYYGDGHEKKRARRRNLVPAAGDSEWNPKGIP